MTAQVEVALPPSAWKVYLLLLRLLLFCLLTSPLSGAVVCTPRSRIPDWSVFLPGCFLVQVHAAGSVCILAHQLCSLRCSLCSVQPQIALSSDGTFSHPHDPDGSPGPSVPDSTCRPSRGLLVSQNCLQNVYVYIFKHISF